MTDLVSLERRGAIALLTLARPNARNALDDAMSGAIVDAAAAINADPTIACVIVTGSGPSFCAGGNVKDMLAGRGMFGGSAAEMRENYRRGIQRVPLAVFGIDVPTIAAVNGPAIGAGCDLALMCDMRIAAREAVFAESFVRLGLVAGDGGAWLLPRIVGTARAYEMTLTGDAVDAEQALRWGLVSAVHPGERLLEEALALAGRIVRHPPHALKLNKRLLRDSEGSTLARSLELAAALQSITQHTEDFGEAVAAFVEKRDPRFVGR
ncbi:MAG: crotonase/enoyl-CoA hydratase family protein [Casimicrobiaceae bacterium]